MFTLESAEYAGAHGKFTSILMTSEELLEFDKGSCGNENNQCSKFVVVIGSERCRTKMNESTPGRCIFSNDIVESTIFKTKQNGPLFYESAALTS
jgi:hypothetical protein